MHQQHGGGVAGAFVDVGDAQSIQIDVLGRVGEVWQAGKAFFGGAQNAGFVNEG